MKRRLTTATAPRKDTCPLPNSCPTKSMIYQTNIGYDIAGCKQKCYLGSYETTFKDKVMKSSSTTLNINIGSELSRKFWKLKKHNRTPEIKWKIIRICRSYNLNS